MKTAEKAAKRPAPPLPPESLAAVILYDDLESGLRARRFVESLAEAVSLPCRYCDTLWALRLMEAAAATPDSGGAAAECEILVLSLRGDREMSPAALAWVAHWAQEAAPSGASIVVIFNSERTAWPCVTSVRSELKKIATATGAAFFCHATASGETAPSAQPPGTRGTANPAGMNTSRPEPIHEPLRIAISEASEAEIKAFSKAFPDDDLYILDSLSETPTDAEILSIFIASRIDAAFLAKRPSLRLIATRSTTWDHIDIDSCRRRGVMVCAVPSYGDHIVAEHVFALLLGLTRKLRTAMRRGFSDVSRYDELRGMELHGKTFGVFGAGRIGRKTAALARAFGMEVIAHDPVEDETVAAALGFSYVAFRELLERSDVISLHAPLTHKTLRIFDASAFSKCRERMLLINTARGRLIDTKALLAGLKSGRIGGAGLDVITEESALRRESSHLLAEQIVERLRSGSMASAGPRSCEIEELVIAGELLNLPNVVFTPHTAFNCVEAIERINAHTIESIQRFREGKPIDAIRTPAEAITGER